MLKLVASFCFLLFAFPVLSQEVSVVSNDITLSGTLLEPDQPTKKAVMIIAGSGPTDRDGNSSVGLKTDCMKLMAESLTKSGYATLRYDKRGIGKSVSALLQPEAMRFEFFVNDAVAWVEFLEKKGYDDITVIGHSQGSLVGMLAAQRSGIDRFISLAGPGFPVQTMLKEQLSAQPAMISEVANPMLDSLAAGHEVKNVPPMLASLFNPSIQPFLRSWMKYDPAEEVKKLKIPVLILQGSTDIQVQVKDGEQLKKAQPSATLVTLEGMNHVLRIAPEDRMQNIATYNQPELPLHPELMSTLISFLEGK